MTKVRGLMIVLHDAHKGDIAKRDVEVFLKSFNFRQYVIAQEPYTHQEGTHIHVFIQFQNQVHFKSILKQFTRYWQHGRVQVDQMRGDMSQACGYLKADFSKKGDRKYYDPEPITYLTKTDADKVQEKVSEITLEEFRKLPIGDMIKLTFPNWDRPPNPQAAENFKKLFSQGMQKLFSQGNIKNVSE